MVKTEIAQRYKRGDSIPSNDFNTQEGLMFFGNVTWTDHLKDRNTAQYTLDGELIWKRILPIQKHIERHTEIQKSQERQIPLFVRLKRIEK